MYKQTVFQSKFKKNDNISRLTFFIKTKIVGGVNIIEQVEPEIYKNMLSYKIQRE